MNLHGLTLTLQSSLPLTLYLRKYYKLVNQETFKVVAMDT